MPDDAPHWPNRWPLFRLLGFALSCAALYWFFGLWNKHAPLAQRYDLAAYVRTSLPPVPFWSTYTVVEHDGNLAIPSDNGDFTLAKRKIDPGRLRSWLQANVYGGLPLWRVLQWPLAGFAAVLLALMVAGGYLDRRTNSEARVGRLIRGPRLISKWRWNWRTRFSKRGLYIETK
jgi:hypothetical protein